ncbi:DUF732 domain-containing protein [Mycobacterium sp.]|uniref:DUF732 domain-containing protein n=1 Tax=Mycobacterium sp. TaxID=1785 RepID=UPI002D0C712B|nr:DUF732 domain-containing protein [Mycobacterium sp.]HTQ16604.1 DUF732 domain-containing protein [Mycobacterium sp.]
MKLPIAIGIACAMVSLAAPANADPGPPVDGDDPGFLAVLRQDGIGYDSPGQAITAGKAVCTCLNNGESGLRLIHDVKTHNPGLDMENASQFALVAAKYYCPQQLSKS